MLVLQDNAELVASNGGETIRLVDSLIHSPIPHYITTTRIIVQNTLKFFSNISSLLLLFFLRLLVDYL
jgi:hypothetical protein